MHVRIVLVLFPYLPYNNQAIDQLNFYTLDKPHDILCCPQSLIQILDKQIKQFNQFQDYNQAVN